MNAEIREFLEPFYADDWRPRTFLEHVADLFGATREELLSQLRLAQWDSRRLGREMKMEGWQRRLTADAAVTQVTSRVRIILGNGLAALAGFSVAQMVGFIVEPRLKELAQSYDIAKDGGRLVLGPTGVGKSVTGVCVLRRRVEAFMEKPDMAWVRALDLPNARLAHRLGDGEPALVTQAAEKPFLIVDDVGWESKRAGADEVVNEVFARRYDAGRPAYVTSGLTLEQFRERYSDAIVRRITESGGVRGKVIDLWGKK